MRALGLCGVALLAVAFTGCAVGRDPPTLTAMVEIRDTLPFTFGMGEQGCTIPQSAAACTASAAFDPGEPEMQVSLKPFALDVHEVTNAQYRYCVKAGGCSEPAGYNGPPGIVDSYFDNARYDNFPVVLLRWNQAKEYCAFAGKRLPTEFEWERVAGGPAKTAADKRVYPWSATMGYQPPMKSCDKQANLALCNGGSAATRAVMTSADDVVIENGVAVHDLAGNVAEFTASDHLRRENFAACDMTLPYTCGDCLTCLKDKPLAVCKDKCLTCQCGKGDPAKHKKQTCYMPCDTPICPRRPADAAPYDGSYTGKNSAQSRVVRGGSYFSYPAGNECAGRSDNRQQALKPEENPQPHIGFRCAKDL